MRQTMYAATACDANRAGHERRGSLVRVPRDPSAEARDRLILHYAGLVTYVASRVGADLPSSVDYSDLIQSGIFGLMEAVARFEPERGLKFETYAVTRIRGAVIDELRALDWVPRSVRKKARDLERGHRGLPGAAQPDPDDAGAVRGSRRHSHRVAPHAWPSG